MPMSTIAAGPSFRYVRLADDIENKINHGVYQVGEKLPSLRTLHAQTGLSITTVYQAYIELEKRGIVEPRQKSGYYVTPQLHRFLSPPQAESLSPEPKKVTMNALAYSIVEDMGNPSFLQLGGSVVMPDLLPHKALAKCMKTANSKQMKMMLMRYGNPYGLDSLKRQIARRMVTDSQQVTLNEMVITNGCIEAVSFCLQAVAKAGDTIVVESPTYPWFLQIIEDLKMFALEVPTDPEHGIDLEALENALDNNTVSACLMIPNFHNPLGFEMAQDKKEALIELLAQNDIPLIEDNIHGDLFFGKSPPTTLKALDKKGLVLHCSSFSKTLSPGLRVGWALPGRYTERVRRLKLNASIAPPTLNQYVIAEFLKGGSYDRHLRTLRRALKNQVANTALAIARHFPGNTRISAPRGGLTLWVELDKGIDGLKLFHAARKHRISIFPGAICSCTGKYRHFIRVSCGYPWDQTIENGITTLAKITRRGFETTSNKHL